jgi:hypothetical protein
VPLARRQLSDSTRPAPAPETDWNASQSSLLTIRFEADVSSPASTAFRHIDQPSSTAIAGARSALGTFRRDRGGGIGVVPTKGRKKLACSPALHPPRFPTATSVVSTTSFGSTNVTALEGRRRWTLCEHVSGAPAGALIRRKGINRLVEPTSASRKSVRRGLKRSCALLWTRAKGRFEVKRPADPSSSFKRPRTGSPLRGFCWFSKKPRPCQRGGSSPRSFPSFHTTR